MRKNWIDNLRWFTVLLVMLYHVFYFYNNKGVFGGVGGFDPDPMRQPQDIVMYILYPWFMMMLAIMGIFMRWFDGTNSFCAYMNRSSYGFYVLHYSIIVSFGYMFKTYTQMPAWLIYLALTIVVFTLTPLLYEVLRRIPLLRWAVLGEKRK